MILKFFAILLLAGYCLCFASYKPSQKSDRDGYCIDEGTYIKVGTFITKEGCVMVKCDENYGVYTESCNDEASSGYPSSCKRKYNVSPTSPYPGCCTKFLCKGGTNAGPMVG